MTELLEGRSGAVFITHPVFRLKSFGNLHPLSISRHRSVFSMCHLLNWFGPGELLTCEFAPRNVIETYHCSRYVDAFERAARDLKSDSHIRKVFGLGTMECPLFDGIWDRAAASVGGSLLAAQCAINGQIAFHPAGGTHHAQKDKAAGFCYFNGPVFAIQSLLDSGVDRVCYVDIDAHHGDGVEAAYLTNPRVQLLSIHEKNRWPYTGTSSQPNYDCYNFSVPKKFNDTEFIYLIDQGIIPLIQSWQPEAVVITCGADVLDGDPLSSMKLSNSTVWDSIEKLVVLSQHVMILGGGGYNPWAVARCWTGLWAKIAGYKIPEKLPDSAKKLLSCLECDLIDDEDINPMWITSMEDTPGNGPIRFEVQNMVKQLDTRADVT